MTLSNIQYNTIVRDTILKQLRELNGLPPEQFYPFQSHVYEYVYYLCKQLTKGE